MLNSQTITLELPRNLIARPTAPAALSPRLAGIVERNAGLNAEYFVFALAALTCTALTALGLVK